MAARVQDLVDLITLYAPIEHSILIVGKHATGKSQVVFQCGELLKVPVVDFRLSQNDVGDMKGMPFHVNGRTFFAPPTWFPLTEEDAKDIKRLLNLTEEISLGTYGPNGILFLDEINRGTKETRQCCFQLIHDRKLNGRSLPPGWRVIAAVNPMDDWYDVDEMDAAFISRFIVVDFEPSIQDWLRWADKAQVHDAVVSFIEKHNEFLDPTKEELAEASTRGIKIVHNRRSWDKFAQMLKKTDSEGKSLLRKEAETNRKLLLIATQYVGLTAGTQFASYVMNDYQSLTAGMILNGWDSKVEGQLKKVLEEGQVTEIALYNKMMIKLTKTLSTLTKKQSANLYKYISTIEPDQRSDFWVKWCAECPAMSAAWINLENSYAELITSTYTPPSLKKGK